MGQPSAALRFLYRTVPGRFLLKGLTAPWLSKAAGALLSTRLSSSLVGPFVKHNHMDLSDYPERKYRSFNDFFTREIKPGKRPFAGENALCSPADGWLSAYRADEDAVFQIKNSLYRISDLLGGDPRWEKFKGGWVLVFRLCVDNYHRYAWFDGGEAGQPVFIPGELHTVQPIAFEQYPVFIRNSREYTFIESDRFGTAAQIEVGALMVGKIANHPVTGRVERGDEKGMFLFGGSTVVVLLEPGKAVVEQQYPDATARGQEIAVRQGQQIGAAL